MSDTKSGDEKTLTVHPKKTLTLNVPAGEIEARKGKWKAPGLRVERGVLAKYAKLASSASEGATTG